jgi:hypothetical protein
MEKSTKVEKRQFDRVLAKLIATPPIRSKELVGKTRQPQTQKNPSKRHAQVLP